MMEVSGVMVRCCKCNQERREGRVYNDYVLSGPEVELIREIFLCKECLAKARCPKTGTE